MAGEKHRYDNDTSGDWYSYCPEHALPSLHVSYIRKVHAEEAAHK